jgi:hypothetical protein
MSDIESRLDRHGWLNKYAPTVDDPNAVANTRQYLELCKAQKAVSAYWQEALAHETRALAISNAAQFAIDRWQEGGSIEAAMEALQGAIDTKHDHTPLADLVPAVALYRLAWQYDGDKPAVIEAARAKLFAAEQQIGGKRWETATTSPQSPTSVARPAATVATSSDEDSASCTIDG